MGRIAYIFVIVALLLAGCAPSGDPKKTLEDYYAHITNAAYDKAYDMLSEADKKATNKEDYILFMKLNAELYKINSVEVTRTGKSGDSVDFDVVEKLHDYYEGKDSNISYKRSVIDENGEWKVFADGKYGERIAGQYNQLGWMFLYGRGGKDKNVNEAANMFNAAIKRDQGYYAAHYGLAVAYAEAGRYDDAIQSANKFNQSTTDKNEQSNGFNVLGLCYQGKGDIEKAKEMFAKAVELNPENEYAKTNLNRLN